MAILIDTSVFIEIERGEKKLDDFIAHSAEQSVAIAAISVSELIHGALRAKAPALRAKRANFIDQIISNCEILSFDLPAARVHAELWAELSAKGINIGAHDLMIAATAIANDMPILTGDRRSFPRIPGVEVIVL